MSQRKKLKSKKAHSKRKIKTYSEYWPGYYYNPVMGGALRVVYPDQNVEYLDYGCRKWSKCSISYLETDQDVMHVNKKPLYIACLYLPHMETFEWIGNL